MTRFHRSEGLTESERVLRDLCFGTFLSLWSYANVFRDQGRHSSGDGKELSDLLVVFGDDVLIFSDKSCLFPTSGDLQRDWGRWYRRAIAKSVDQVLGAERWLRQHPDRVFLDARCTIPLPIQLPSAPRFHRIVVATGARTACARVHGGAGGLLLRPSVVGEDHYGASAEPFVVGRPEPNRVVHVFDDLSIFQVLRQLDTVVDLVAYLRKKEELIASGRLEFSPDESCLLAVYLARVDETGHIFPQTAPGVKMVIDPDAWNDFVTNPNVRRKATADEPSYIWDRLIELFSHNLEHGLLVGADANEIATSERLLRFMAATSRVERRSLGQALLDVRQMPVERGTTFGARMIARGSRSSEEVFVVMAVKNVQGEDYEAYRRFRSTFLHGYAHIAKKRFPGAKKIFGIAVDAGGTSGGSEDALLFDVGDWGAEDYAKAHEMAVRLGLETTPPMLRVRDWEFPPTLGATSPSEIRKARNRAKRQRREDRRR